MDTRNFNLFMERLGFEVYEGAGSFWSRMGGGFLLAHPYHYEIDPDERDLRALMRKAHAWGVKYNRAPGGREARQNATGGIYLLRGAGYDASQLDSNKKRDIIKGLKLCEVRRAGPDEVSAKAFEINREVLERQNRRDALFDSEQGFKRTLGAIKTTEGAEIWAAFAEGALAAYIVTFRIDDTANILYHFSSSRLQKMSPNDALAYAYAKEMASKGLTVSYGLVGLVPNPGLDKFKRRLGFTVEPREFTVRLGWQLRPLSAFSLPGLVGRAGRALKSDRLAKLGTLLELARHGRQR